MVGDERSDMNGHTLPLKTCIGVCVTWDMLIWNNISRTGLA